MAENIGFTCTQVAASRKVLLGKLAKEDLPKSTTTPVSAFGCIVLAGTNASVDMKSSQPHGDR